MISFPDGRSVFIFSFLLLLNSTLVLGLKCYECANMLNGPNTCTSPKQSNTSSPEVKCRKFVYGGVVVGQGSVSAHLCGPEALRRTQISIRRFYVGSGDVSIDCCDTDLCNAASNTEATARTSRIPPTLRPLTPKTSSPKNPIHPLEMEDEAELVRNAGVEPSKLEAQSSSKFTAENGGASSAKFLLSFGNAIAAILLYSFAVQIRAALDS